MAVDQIKTAIGMLIIAAVILSLGSIVMVQMKAQAAYVQTAENTTWVGDNVTSMTFPHTAIESVSVYNETDATVLVEPGNYTLTLGALPDGPTTLVILAGEDEWDEQPLQVNYTYRMYDSEVMGSMNQTASALGDWGTWLALIVVAIAAAVVLLIVIKTFNGLGFGRDGGV